MEQYNLSVSLDMFDSIPDMLDMLDMDVLAYEDEFPSIMSALALENSVPDADEKWQTTTTNEIYADFDSYIDPVTQRPSVASFAELMDVNWKSNLLPSPQKSQTTHSPPQIQEMQRPNEQLAIIGTGNEDSMEGLLTLSNKQNTTNVKPTQKRRKLAEKENVVDCYFDDQAEGFLKPTFSFSCLIAMAMKNSGTGSLMVPDIYSFICEQFPYYKTASSSWRNSVRHSLSTNKCFVKEVSYNERQQKRCLWSLDSSKIAKMDEQIAKFCTKDPKVNRKAIAHPENLESIRKGERQQLDERRCCQDINEASDDDWAWALAAAEPRAENDVEQNCCVKDVDSGDEANPSKRLRLENNDSITAEEVYQLWLSTTAARSSQLCR